jgi:Domain of unknown function (DUF4332)
VNPLLAILRAAHCRSTHHYFAIDALPRVQTEAGQRFVKHLMRHHDRYLTGAKDPDVRFRDFQNHVVHVADSYWGGAPRVAHKWYDRLQQEIERGDYQEAAYAAGVLSHYFTDPFQPLHTGQTQREGIVHRPIEWSINQSYGSILKRWQDSELKIVFQLSDQPAWLGEAILHGARFAHRHYDLLVNTYRLERGVRQPTEGLTDEACVALAELFGLTITGWACVLDRAATEAESRLGQEIPAVGVTLATVMAAIKVPHRLWLRRVEAKEEREALQLLVEEYRDTGNVVENLPAEVDIKQRVAKIYADERQYRDRLESKSKVEQLTEPIASVESPSLAKPKLANSTLTGKMHASNQFAVASKAEEYELAEPERDLPIVIPFVRPEVGSSRLNSSSELVDAPSIGPKTAARFAAIGVHTVGEFVAQSADDLATRLATAWITTEIIRSWQSQTVMMCQLDCFKTRDVQLLVGAGFTKVEQLSSEPVLSIHREVQRFALTSAGARYRRGAEPPTFDEVRGWRDAAIRFGARPNTLRDAG